MNIRDLINKVDQLDERGPRIPMRGFQGGRPENREFHNVGGSNNGMNALAPALAGGALGYALANRGGQGGGYQQQAAPMQPGTTTTTTEPAIPVGQPYLDTANTHYYGPQSDQNPMPAKNNDEDEIIGKINDLVAQLLKTQVPVPHSAPEQNSSPSNTTKPSNKLLPVDPNVKAYQNALIAAGVKLPKYGADGRWGSETSQASMDPKAQAVNKQFGSLVPQLAQAPNFIPKSKETKLASAATNLDDENNQVFNWGESTTHNIADALIESFGYEALDEFTANQAYAVGKELAPPVAAGVAVNQGAKLASKAGLVGKEFAEHLPGVNIAFNAVDTYKRLKEKDYAGAAISAASALASMSVVGVPLSYGLDALNLARDYQAGKLDALLPDDWQKKHPKDSIKIPTQESINFNVAENIANLRNRLSLIELSESLVGDIADAGKAAKGAEEAELAAKAAKDASTVHKADPTNPNTIKNNKAQADQTMGTTKPVGDDPTANWYKPKTDADKWFEAEQAVLQGEKNGVIPVGTAKEIKSTPGGLRAWIKANPTKANAIGIVGLLGLGGAAGLLGNTSHEEPAPVPTNKPEHDQNSLPSSPVELTPDQEELIRQIKELEQYGSQEQGFKDFKWRSTTSHADAIISRYKKDEATPPKQADNSPDIKKDDWEESINENDELSRWLKIARG